MRFAYDDGGRKAAGYKGTTGDCGVRAIAIATGRPYQEVYDLVKKYASTERITKRRRTRSGPRDGIRVATMRRIMADLGWLWVPAMGIGTGCTAHLTEGELPGGPIIVRVSKHYAAVIDHVIRDTYDDQRNGTRCVYGWWEPGAP